MNLSRKALLGRPAEFAINSAHAVAFHRGLGNPLHPSSTTPMTKYLDHFALADYSKAAYAKSNFAVVANGADHQELTKWVGEFFTNVEQSPPKDFPTPGIASTQYYGGEERIAHDSGNTMVIAFPGSGSVTGNSYKPEARVLAELLGGQSNIKWTSGFSLFSKATEAYPQAHITTMHHTYSDAGLLTISISGNAQQIRGASQEVAKILKNVAAGQVSSEEIRKARAAAKFKALESGQNVSTGIELTGAGLVQGGKPFQIDELGRTIDAVTDEQVKKAAKSLLDGKASVSSVGDLYELPFAEELGLNV
ncbi:ubiquinol-cytochrome c reductase core subunit 1 [Lecanora helva]